MKLSILTTLCTASLLILSGCVATPKPNDQTLVDASLPKIELTKNGIIAEANSIAFEWKSITDPRVKGIYIYKESPTENGVKGQLSYYETISNRFATHYVDTKIKPDSKYSYTFKTFSKDAQSVPSNFIYVNSAPVLESVSWIHSINGMPRTAKIIWRPHINQKVKSYIVERKAKNEKVFEEIGRVDGRLNVEYIDTDLKDNYVYEYRVRVLTFDNLVSSASRSVSVITKALPKAVKNLSASKNLPKEIALRWNKYTDEDFAMYHLYRAESKDGSYELIAKLHNNFYKDKVSIDQKKYYYRVSVVDKDGLESESDTTTAVGSTLVKPKAPTSLQAMLLGNKIELTWSNLDERNKKYIIKKTEKTGWLQETESQHTTNGSLKFIDLNIQPDTTYIYKVYGVDKNSIVSEPSAEVKVKTPESTKIMNQKLRKQTESIVLPQENIKIEGETIIPNKDLNLNEI